VEQGDLAGEKNVFDLFVQGLVVSAQLYIGLSHITITKIKNIV